MSATENDLLREALESLVRLAEYNGVAANRDEHASWHEALSRARAVLSQTARTREASKGGKWPWRSVSRVPYRTIGYGGGTMLRNSAGSCIGYVIAMNRSAKVDPSVLDDAVFSALSATTLDLGITAEEMRERCAVALKEAADLTFGSEGGNTIGSSLAIAIRALSTRSNN